ncbi:MAG: molybdenum cofactor guanylyltransferase [Deltaproteobacteria bacterium]|nr:molybdenum cofactor guanylyltransferase [Deltaproteobacteria bacterium]
MTGGAHPILPPAAAIILAGGASTRLGFDKRVLLVDGVPIVDHLHGLLRPLFDPIIISSGDPQRWAHLDARVVADRAPGVGPLMGLLCCLEVSPCDRNFVIACDIPRPPVALIRRLLDEALEHDGAVPVTPDEFYEPLCGVYRRKLLPAIERMVATGERRPRALYEEYDFAYVPLSDFGLVALANVNTCEDLTLHLGGTGSLGRAEGT